MATVECEPCGTEIDSVAALEREESGMVFCGDSCGPQHVYASSDEDDDEEDDNSDDDTDTEDDDEVRVKTAKPTTTRRRR